MRNPRSIFVGVLAVWLMVATALVTVVTWRNEKVRAVVGMGWGLILLWIGLCGSLMYRFREPIRRVVLSIRLDWRLKFILLATALALLEEAITTTMTNLAPLFGVKVGEAYITASANYLDVVALHSVVIFVPMFVAWALILWRYDFSPFAVFLLFGLSGTLMETNLGTRNPLEFGLWIFVYGLMVYLPAYCVPTNRKTRPLRWWHYPLAVVVPFLFIPLVPLPLLAGLLFPHHPKMHFPPIGRYSTSARACAQTWRLSPAQVRDQRRQPADQNQSTHHAKEADHPGNADPQGRPLDPPMAGRGHQVDDHQEDQNQRPHEQEPRSADSAQH
jgi:hypothetical protein